jgi:DNA-binding winged helix-turn-helix (wHTH) protein
VTQSGSFECCASACDAIQVGRFQVLPRVRELRVDGRPIEIGGRAFDLLVVLLNARGTVVSKEEIVHQVWPSIIVTKANLRAQVAILRKVLGEHAHVIKNVPRRGYIFLDEGVPVATAAVAVPSTGSSPSQLSGDHDSRKKVAVDVDPNLGESLHGESQLTRLCDDLLISIRRNLANHRSLRSGHLVFDVLIQGQGKSTFALNWVRLRLLKAKGNRDRKLGVPFG